MKRFLLMMAVQLLLMCGLWAQVNNASLSGLVTDSTGAIVEGAKVTAHNKATGAERSSSTSAGGYFTFAVLPIGEYEIRVEKDGFRQSVSQVTLEVGQKARQDFALKVGSARESVNVEATAPLLSTQDASPGAVIQGDIIHEAPLSARNWDDLLGLVAGVQGDRYTEQGGGTAAGRTGAANVHGVRSLQNNFVLDGVDNNSFSENVQELTTQIVRPSVDAIEEFKVSTNPYSAENGRSPGSAVSVTTKGGTNLYHGLLYEYLRNKIFDANDYFTNRAGRPRPAKAQNQFGGQIGGPIVKNKAFFFLNYEGTRIRTGRFYQANVPTLNERLGDFSAAAGAANGVTYSALVDRVGDCVGKGNPFPNNQIPASCIDPAAAKILALVPKPNFTPVSGALNIGNFTNVRSLQDDANNYTGRFDWNPSSTDNVFVRYTNSHRLRYVPGTFGGILDGTSTSAAGRLQMNGAAASIGWNHVFSPRLVNEFRIGWGRNWSKGVQDPFGLNKESDYIAGVPDNDIYNGGIPRIAISARGGAQSNTTSTLGGVDNWGSPDFLPKAQYTNQFQWLDTISLTIGKHQIRAGVDSRVPMRNIFVDVPALRGRLTFDGNRTGNGLADFLLGYPQSAELANPVTTDARLWMLSEFFQDDWKITPKLTMNYGLRYDYATWPYSGNDKMTNVLDPNRTAVNATATLITPANSPYGHTLVKPDKNNFAPRIGFAYQVMPNTVIRAGYGRFYMLFERAGSEDQMFLNPPYLIDKLLSAPSTSVTANATSGSTNNGLKLRTGFTGVSLDPNAQASTFLTSIRLRSVNPDNVMPEVDQWNVGVEHQLPGQVVLTVEYVGTKGTHLSILENLNQQYFDSLGRACVAVGAASPNCPTLGAPGAQTAVGLPAYLEYSNLGAVEWRNNVGNSTYHGLEVSANKRYSKGLSFTTAYTWSHSIDSSMEQLYGGGSSTFLQNMHDLTQWRGNSDFDTRHRLSISGVYDLPFGPKKAYVVDGPLSHIVRGWRMSTISAVHSGRPFTIFSGNNNSLVQVGGQLGSALGSGVGGGACNSVSGNINDTGGSGPYWFDTTKFSIPTAPNPTGAGTVAALGNCPRNNMYGPGLFNVDFALTREFEYFGEGRNLAFRWEVFNLLNKPYFGLPGRDVSNASAFGRITNLQGDPRVMQFALRFSF